MARGGKRPGAGRRPGQTNKLTARAKHTLSELAREHTGAAMGVLVKIMKDDAAPHAARATAANSILDRGWGKPTQDHRHGGPTGGAIPTIDVTKLKGMTEQELEALERALVQIGIVDGDPGGEGDAED